MHMTVNKHILYLLVVLMNYSFMFENIINQANCFDIPAGNGSVKFQGDVMSSFIRSHSKIKTLGQFFLFIAPAYANTVQQILMLCETMELAPVSVYTARILLMFSFIEKKNVSIYYSV